MYNIDSTYGQLLLGMAQGISLSQATIKPGGGSKTNTNNVLGVLATASSSSSFWSNPGAYLPSVPQGVMDFSAGLGDAILFGFGGDIRDSLGIDGGVNGSSDMYAVGEVASITAGGLGLFRGMYVGSFKVASMSRSMTILNSASAVRNFQKRFMGPALFRTNERVKIVPFATHVENKGFDAARTGLGRTRGSYNSLIGLSPGIGGVFND